MKSVLRRMALLFNFYGGGEPPLDYRGLVERAHKVKLANSNLRWLDRQRHSFLKGIHASWGLVGSITYQGKLDEFLPLLRLAEKVHVGKNSAFGLGLVRLSLNPGEKEGP